MTVNEPGQHHPPVRIHDLCGRPDVCVYVLFITDPANVIGFYCHRLCPRLLGIHGVNPRVADHEICLVFARRLPPLAGGENP